MLDKFDLSLLEAVQRNDGRTAEELAEEIALSPSAIARRLRRLRSDGWIARTIALLSDKLTAPRTASMILIQLDNHVPRNGLDRLRHKLADDEAVQWCAEISGGFDIALLCDHASPQDFGDWADAQLAQDPAIRRYETSFVKRRIRNQPFVSLTE